MDPETTKRAQGDLNFMSLNKYKTYVSNHSHRQKSDQDDQSYSTNSLSIFSDRQIMVNVQDIIAFYDNVDHLIFDDEVNWNLIYSEKIHYDNISQIENQRLILQFNISSKIYLAMNLDNKSLVVIKITELNTLEDALQKLDEHKIHNQIYQKYPTQCIELFTPVSVKKISQQLFLITSSQERALFNLYDYSRKYQITTEEAIYILYEMLKQISNMHSINIAHRDVKPQNIFYVVNKGWLLSDFGESCEYTNNDDNYNIRGTAYFLIPQLKQHILYNTKIRQNLLKNDLYALVVSIIMIQSDQYIHDMINEIKQSNDNLLQQVLQIDSLSGLKYLIEKNQQLINRNYLCKQNLPIYKELNIEEIKQNQLLVYQSWIQLYDYMSCNQINPKLYCQLLKLIEQQVMQNIKYTNCTILEEIYLFQIRAQYNIIKVSILMKNKDKLNNICCVQTFLTILFNYGFNDKVIQTAKKILMDNYIQDIHQLMILSYERIMESDKARQEFIIFNQNLQFDQLNTKNKYIYISQLQIQIKQNTTQVCENYNNLLSSQSQKGEFFIIDEIPSLQQKLEQYLGDKQKNANIILDITIKYLLNFCSGSYSRCQEKAFADIIYLLMDFQIEVYQNFLIRILKMRYQIFDLNKRSGLLKELAEIYNLQNNYKDFKKTLKQIKLIIHDPDSQQQIVCLKITCYVLLFQQKLRLCQINDLLKQIIQQIPQISQFTYQRYKLFMCDLLLNFITYQHFNSKQTLSSKYICVLQFTMQYLHHIEFQQHYPQQFSALQLIAAAALQSLKNYKRCQFLINDYCSIFNQGQLFFINQFKQHNKALKQSMKYNSQTDKNYEVQNFIFNQYLNQEY